MVKEYENNGTALAEALGKPYAFIYRLSDVHRGKTPQDFVPDKELMEAHFFDGKEEIRFINAATQTVSIEPDSPKTATEIGINIPNVPHDVPVANESPKAITKNKNGSSISITALASTILLT